MKKYALKSSLILVLFTCVLSIVSCKKNSQNECLLKVMYASGSFGADTSFFSYNTEKKIIAATTSSSSNTYIYSGNNYVRKNTSGLFESRDSIIIQKDNLIREIYSFNTANVLNRKQSYTYNSSDNLIQYTDQNFIPAGVDIYNIDYADGDVISLNKGITPTATFTYYTDKSAAKGDYLDIFQFINFGFGKYLKSKHLIKTMKNGSAATVNFSYEFDSHGNVSKLTASDGVNTDTYTYTYTCD